MTWRKTVATALLTLVVVLCMTGCPNKPPATPGAPWGADSTWTYSTYTCSVVTTTSKGAIRYVMDWQDAIDTSDVDFPYASNETAAVTHVWDAVGTYNVKAQAIRNDDPKKASDFSPAKSVKVVLNQRPVVDSVIIPPIAVKGAPTNITVYGHDDDGDSLRAIVKWPKGDTTTGLTPTPYASTVTNIFDDVGTARVIVWVQDWKKAKSLPDTVSIPVGLEGGVKWWWQSPTDSGVMYTPALVAFNGTVEVVMSASWDEPKFFQVRASNGNNIRNATTKSGEDDFTGGSALCTATGNVIVGGEDGELYALSLASLSRSWQWPNLHETLLSGIVWGAPAINGIDIYVGRDQDVDSLYRLYKFTDNGASVTPGPAYVLHDQGVVDAPAIDADGSVYFGTDSGYLIKIDANLSSPLWRKHLIPNGEIGGPIIGSDGTVYCCSDSPPALHAVTSGPDSGVVIWTFLPDGFGGRPALGQSALFIGTDQGTIYSLNPNTGSINWQKSYSGGVSFNTTPVVAANGYVYFQGDNDVLYCLNQADGAQIWTCNCDYYLPGGGRSGSSHRPRIAGLADYDPEPSITSTGDIIVVGQGALFCVAGYADGTLDASAAWPKWQKNLFNTGKK